LSRPLAYSDNCDILHLDDIRPDSCDHPPQHEGDDLADNPPVTLTGYLRRNLARMLDTRGTRREAAAALDMHPSAISRLLNSDSGWAALSRLETRLRDSGYDPMEMLGPVPAMLGLVERLDQQEMYLVGRLLMQVSMMDKSMRGRWLQVWVDATEMMSQGYGGPEAGDR